MKQRDEYQALLETMTSFSYILLFCICQKLFGNGTKLYQEEHSNTKITLSKTLLLG